MGWQFRTLDTGAACPLRPDRAYAILANRRKSPVSEFVFSSQSFGPRGYSAIAIRKAMRRAGLTDCTIHTLRHTLWRD